jgi:hypothetical protein
MRKRSKSWTSAEATRRRRVKQPQRRDRKATRSPLPFRPTKALREELRRTMEEIEIAVGACVQRRRWADLEVTVSSYALMLGGADPTAILASAMLRPVAREAVTITDPDLFLVYARCVYGWIELSRSGMPLSEAVEHVRRSVEHGCALQAFESIDSTSGGVH